MRGVIALLPLMAALAAFSGCAKKRATIVVPQVPPPITSGETGLASWYGHPYHGRAAADGEIYDMETLVAAHRTLPFGTMVRVTNLGNGKTVDVRIIDRGPFVDGRVIDLSHAAAEAIGSVGPGIAQVRLDILSLPAMSSAGNWFAVQAGAFLDRDRAERLRGSLEQEYGRARLVLRPGPTPMWRVLVGQEPTQDGAVALAAKLRKTNGTGFVVRLDVTTSVPGNAAGSDSDR